MDFGSYFKKQTNKTQHLSLSNYLFSCLVSCLAESAGELESHLMKVEEESEKVGLKLNIQKAEIMVSGPITSWQIDGETVETVAEFIFSWLQNHC